MGGSSKDKHHSSSKSSGSKTSSSRNSSSKHSKSKHASDRNSNGEGSSRNAREDIPETIKENEQEQQPRSGHWEARQICCHCRYGTDLQANRHFACMFCQHKICDDCEDTKDWVEDMNSELPLNYDPQSHQNAPITQEYDAAQGSSYDWQG